MSDPQYHVVPDAEEERCMTFAQLIVLNLLSCAACFVAARMGGFSLWASIGLGYVVGAVVTVALAVVIVCVARISGRGAMATPAAPATRFDARFLAWDAELAAARMTSGAGVAGGTWDSSLWETGAGADAHAAGRYHRATPPETRRAV